MKQHICGVPGHYVVDGCSGWYCPSETQDTSQGFGQLLVKERTVAGGGGGDGGWGRVS